MFSQIIKWATLGLVIVSYNISTAAAQCSTSGDELVDRIDFEIIPKAIQVLEAVPDPGRDGSMNALATAVTEIGEICTCNINQSAYVSISLSQISLLRTLTICKYDVPPESFQQCSSAANALPDNSKKYKKRSWTRGKASIMWCSRSHTSWRNTCGSARGFRCDTARSIEPIKAFACGPQKNPEEGETGYV